jgi:hypothetical protein
MVKLSRTSLGFLGDLTLSAAGAAGAVVTTLVFATGALVTAFLTAARLAAGLGAVVWAKGRLRAAVLVRARVDLAGDLTAVTKRFSFVNGVYSLYRFKAAGKSGAYMLL